MDKERRLIEWPQSKYTVRIISHRVLCSVAYCTIQTVCVIIGAHSSGTEKDYSLLGALIRVCDGGSIAKQYLNLQVQCQVLSNCDPWKVPHCDFSESLTEPSPESSSK